jgi:choline dehydrogenase
VGIPTFSSNNGRVMEGERGASIMDLRVRDGQRLSIFRSYTYPYMDRPNLTVLTHALVTRVVFHEKRATGVEVVYDDRAHRITAGFA